MAIGRHWQGRSHAIGDLSLQAEDGRDDERDVQAGHERGVAAGVIA
jgi:hypothetical protein